MNILRTPEDRFQNLPGYPWQPHYTTVRDQESGLDLRIAHVEDGPPESSPVLFLHGEPSWSYLYRKMIPPLAVAGHRAIAPDLVGFGRSDKPDDRSFFTYRRHVAWMREWLELNDLDHITLVCQDWGSLIGLRLVAEIPERFDRVVVANGGLPTGPEMGSALSFRLWRTFSRFSPWFPIGRIIQEGSRTSMSEAEVAAYDAPFPDTSYKAAARAFPSLVPISARDPASPDNVRAWESLRKFTNPFLTAFSSGDPITRGGEQYLQKQIPGAKGQPHTTIHGGGHFLQEDRGAELAKVVIDFIAGTPRQG